VTVTKNSPNDQQTHTRRPPVTEHGPDCTGPSMVYQPRLWPTGPLLGYCRSCGAVAITRTVTS